MPAFARDVLHLGEQGYGFLLGASGVGALIGALTTATFGTSISPRKLAFGGVWLFSLMLLIFSFNRNLTIAMLCLAGTGFGMMLFFSTSNTTVQTIVPDEMRGRVMGIWALIFGGMIPFGSLEAGSSGALCWNFRDARDRGVHLRSRRARHTDHCATPRCAACGCYLTSALCQESRINPQTLRPKAWNTARPKCNSARCSSNV